MSTLEIIFLSVATSVTASIITFIMMKSKINDLMVSDSTHDDETAGLPGSTFLESTVATDISQELSEVLTPMHSSLESIQLSQESLAKQQINLIDKFTDEVKSILVDQNAKHPLNDSVAVLIEQVGNLRDAFMSPLQGDNTDTSMNDDLQKNIIELLSAQTQQIFNLEEAIKSSMVPSHTPANKAASVEHHLSASVETIEQGLDPQTEQPEPIQVTEEITLPEGTMEIGEVFDALQINDENEGDKLHTPHPDDLPVLTDRIEPPASVANQDFSHFTSEHLGLPVDEIPMGELRKALKHSNLTVMVVDDSRTMRMVNAKFLENAHMKVLQAEHGQDALALIDQGQRPDYFILDVSMPVMDGYELAQHIRSHPDLSNTPIIMISGKDGKMYRQRASKMGVYYMFDKDFDKDFLLRCIHYVTSSDAGSNAAIFDDADLEAMIHAPVGSQET